MEINKNIAQLKYESDRLGLQIIPTGKKGKVLKKDYVNRLQTYNLFKTYGSLNNIPTNIRFRATFDSPELAYNYFDLKVKEQDAIWESPDIWLTEKINGIRGTLVYSKKTGYSIFGREVDANTYLWGEYAGRLIDWKIAGLSSFSAFDIEICLGNQAVKSRLKEMGYDVYSDLQAIAVLFTLTDSLYSEITAEYSNLYQFKLIDVYWYKEDMRQKSYKDREVLFDDILIELKQVGIPLSRPQICKDPAIKKAFHEGILKNGGEGTIAVFSENPCNLAGNRKRTGMIKIKRSIFTILADPNALTDTVDGWVSSISIKHGLVHSVIVSAYDSNGVENQIAVVDAIPLSIRLANTIEEGKVVELSGDKWEGLKIVNPVIERVRFDKSSSDCILMAG